jgi:phosphatidylserine decarboxylase
MFNLLIDSSEMKIHKEGYTSILLVFITIVIVITGVILLLPVPVWLEFIIYLSGALVLLFTIMFFRVPVRNATYADDKIFSGADGKVVAIEEVMENEFFNDKRVQVSVFMGVTNVHVNYAPLSGTVKYFKYHPGKHLVAWHPKSSTDNERTTIVVENKVTGPVLIRQIAGAFARRIVCHLREGNQTNQGSEIGIIKFGSRVDLLLPLHAEVKVKLDQHVRGGETVIATIRKQY